MTFLPDRKNRSRLHWIFLALPPVGTLLAYLLLQTPPLVVVSPETGFDSTHFQLRWLTDRYNGGHSSIMRLNIPANTLSYRYLLDNTVNEPIARVFIEPTQGRQIDLSAYNSLQITLQSQKGKRIPVILCHPVHIHSDPQEIKTYHLLVNYADADRVLTTHTLRFRDFATPDWWYSYASNQQYQNQTYDMSKAQYLVLSNGAFSGNKNEDTVTVSDLRFVYDFRYFFLWSAGLAGLYYAVYVLLLYFPKSLGAQKIYLLYKKIDTVNYEAADKQAVLESIQQHFQQHELTISDIQKETGIHERKIAALLKKHVQLSFKQYVNQLRIEHAKKMLVETTFPITDIAYASGYNSVSHFNRVFKAEEQCSPQEYRQRKTRDNS